MATRARARAGARPRLKWFVKGWGENRDARGRMVDIPPDVANLHRCPTIGDANLW